MSIKGWPTQEKDDRLSPQYATVEPVRQLQQGLSVLSHEFVREVGTDAVEANSTTTVINATGHAAQVGDVIRITSGTLSGLEVKVYSVATNAITLAEELASVPALGVTFQILRHKYPLVDSTGSLITTATEVATAADGGALPAVVKVVGGYDGSAVQVIKTDAAGEVQVDVKSIEGIIDANNSTSTPLSGGGNFTGGWTEIKDYNSINLGVFSDVASASDGLKVEYSADGVSVHHTHTWTFPGGTNGIGYQLAAEFRYFRVNYTNGASAQTSFIVQANLKPTALFPSSYRASTTFTSQSQVILTKGIIVGETTGGGGGYVPVKVNPSGALTVEATISSIDSALDGQKTMAASLPVVIASDQSAVPASQSGTWNINNVSGTVSLPTGAATAARQDTGNNHLASLALSAVQVGSTFSGDFLMAGGTDGTDTYPIRTDAAGVVQVGDNGSSLTVDGTVTANQGGTWNITNVSGTVSLPTGAATAANQTGGSQKTQIVDGSGNVIAATSNALNVSAVQAGTWNINNVSGTISLPTGASTESTLSTVSSTLTTLNGTTIPNRLPTTGTKTMSGSVSVTLASNQTAMPIYYAGRAASNRARIDYTSTSVTTAAYTQLLASTSAAINEVEIFDSSGQTLVLATGTAGAEADQVYIFPGGNGRIPLAIATSTRVAIKAVSATANTGEISVNFYS